MTTPTTFEELPMYRCFITLFVALLLLPGCTMFQNTTPEQSRVLVRSLSRTATVVALEQIEGENKVRVARTMVDGSNQIIRVLSALSDINPQFREPVTVELVRELLKSVQFMDDPALAVLAESLVDIVLSHMDLEGVETSLVNDIGRDNILLLLAAIEGIHQGAIGYVDEVLRDSPR
jgi:hypothetical protein